MRVLEREFVWCFPLYRSLYFLIVYTLFSHSYQLLLNEIVTEIEPSIKHFFFTLCVGGYGDDSYHRGFRLPSGLWAKELGTGKPLFIQETSLL